ncbi:hypothetical protein [Actinacidiphila rubida]|uniref:Uncharacterized protein n=1 Tax=Actinacidiphila rubida TaxID=310780 RepID=A0A1H8DQI9_9ACTN|nr:hypothetical protein [Actinacidiphila rubida]SEN09466.1 hypothetical protein SAMN05216267_1001238 [Actinacidiphila rubida]
MSTADDPAPTPDTAAAEVSEDAAAGSAPAGRPGAASSGAAGSGHGGSGLVFDDPFDRPSSDDTDRGWGGTTSDSSDDDFTRFLNEKPPHHL